MGLHTKVRYRCREDGILYCLTCAVRKKKEKKTIHPEYVEVKKDDDKSSEVYCGDCRCNL